MVKILNQPGLGENIGRSLGEGFSSGISETLKHLAKRRADNLLKKRDEDAFEALGYPREFAHYPATVIKDFLGSFEPQQNPEEAPTNGLDSLKNNQEPSTPKSTNELLKEGLMQQQEKPQVSAIKKNIVQPTDDLEDTEIEQKAKPKVSESEAIEMIQEPETKKPKTLAEQVAAKKRKQEEEKQKKIQEHEQEKIDKETLDSYTDIKKQSSAAKEGNLRFNKLRDLVHKGNLTPSVFGSALEALSKGVFSHYGGPSLDLFGWTHPDTQEFKKLVRDFSKFAKDFFPGRVTDNDLRTYLETLPSLAMSDRGKLRVIDDLQMFNEIVLAKEKIMEDIIEKNGGRRPRHMDTLIDKQLNPIRDQIAKRFKDLPEPVPEYEKKLLPGQVRDWSEMLPTYEYQKKLNKYLGYPD